MKKQTMSRKSLSGLLFGILLGIVVASGAQAVGDGVQEKIGEILTNLSANGEYVIGAHYQKDDSGKMQIIVETGDGTKFYDESGQLKESVDKNGNTTIYQDGIPVKTISPTGQLVSKTSVKAEKQSGSKWLTSRDYMGNLERRRMNSDGEMIERVDQQGNAFKNHTHKDARGKTKGVTEVNQRTGERTSRYFDQRTGDIKRVVQSNGDILQMSYVKDKKGRKLKSYELNQRTGLTTEKQFDDQGREIGIISPNGEQKYIQYIADKQGHVVASTEQVSNKDGNGESYSVTKTFDAANRVTSEKDSMGREITYSYRLNMDGTVSEIEEEETLVNEQGKEIHLTRTRIMGDDGRLKTLLEGLHRTEYTYDVGENGIVESVREVKYVDSTNQKLYEMTTEKNKQGQSTRSEKWESLGAEGKRHSVTTYVNDEISGKTEQTITTNDLGDITVTHMNEFGMPICSESITALGPILKRHTTTFIKTDKRTKMTLFTESYNDLGERTLTEMNEYGVAVRTESWTPIGAKLKRHNVTSIENNPETNLTAKTESVNDLGDKSTTFMNGEGLPVLSESEEVLGATLGRKKTTVIQPNPFTGLTQYTYTQDPLRESISVMDEQGLPMSSDSWETYGPRLKQHSFTLIKCDKQTGVSKMTGTINDLGDVTVTTMDDDGLPTESESWSVLGAELKRHNLSTLTVNKDTGVTAASASINDLGDRTTTEMNKHGLAVFSESLNVLGAIKKRHSLTTIDCNDDTGITKSTESINDLGDRSKTSMDEDGMALLSENWNVLGAELKRHSRTVIECNGDSGMTKKTESLNDLGDYTESIMDQHGLAVSSESQNTLGAIKKRHSLTTINTNPATGMTDMTNSVNDLGDRTKSQMDRNGLSLKSESWNALGALYKRHSISAIQTNIQTGMTEMTKNINDLGDVTMSQMNIHGLSFQSQSQNVLGAGLKRNSITSIQTDSKTGMTRFTKNVNELGDMTFESKDGNGFTLDSKSVAVLGAELKRTSWKTVDTDELTGLPLSSRSVNELGDVSETFMDANGLPIYSTTEDVLGPTSGRNKTTDISVRFTTGMTEQTESYDALHNGPTTTYMDDNGLAYYSQSISKYGATTGAEKRTDIVTDQDTGISRTTYTYDNLHQGPAITYMDENGLAYESRTVDLLGASAGWEKHTRMLTNPQTGVTEATYTKDDLHVGEVETFMDENGMAYYSHGVDVYGASAGREKTTLMQCRSDIGTMAETKTYDALHAGPVISKLDEHGLAYHSSSTDVYGARKGLYKETKIYSRRDLGTSERTETYDLLHDGPVVTLMDENGFAYQSTSRDVSGAEFGKDKVTKIFTRSDIGTSERTESYDGLHDGAVVSLMDENGLAYGSYGVDKYGPRRGREKITEIVSRPDTGITQSTYTVDALHAGPVETKMDENGLPISSKSVDRFGPSLGREKMTVMTVDQDNGITRETQTYDALHQGPVIGEMDENGFSVKSVMTNTYGPAQARYQVSRMTPDPNTGLTLRNESETLSGPNGTLISSNTTENDPVYGLPVRASSVSSFGSWRDKETMYAMDLDTGLTLRSVVVDGGGYSENEHGELGIDKSTRHNILGAIKTSVTTNTLDSNTGLTASSISVDRKGTTASNFNANGESQSSTRTNNGAHAIPSESTQVQSFNPYTGSPLVAISYDAQGTTTKYSDLDGFMESSVRIDKWGDRSTTTYTNNRITGLPTNSVSTSASGTSETWFEDNGLGLHSTFTARLGLHSETWSYYDANLDIKSTKALDERGNVSINLMNGAGEVTHTYSKNGTTTMDLYNARAASASGPGGTTSYQYSGKYLSRTNNRNSKGENTTSWYDQRSNGSTNRVRTDDGTTSYSNRYNSRGFVTYRTERNDKGDKGFSRFNHYGDQLYTEWKGKIKGDSPDQYGNQFLGGSWWSKTHYNVNSRGDVKSWTTESGWRGTMKLVEIGHFEYVCTKGYDSQGACKGGTEQYVVDQQAGRKGVGDSEGPETEYPEHDPKSDSWVMSHLRGSQPGGVDMGASRLAQGRKIQTVEEGLAAVEGSRDGTTADYHSVYQRNLCNMLASQGYAAELKESYAPMVNRITDLLKSFAETGDLDSLYRIGTYVYADFDAFNAEFQRASNKVDFVKETVDTAYYHFSGEHITNQQLNLTNVSSALNIVERPTTTLALQDWLEFVASEKDQAEVGKLLKEIATDLQTETNEVVIKDTMKLLYRQLSDVLKQIAKKNLGQTISKSLIQSWLEQSMESSMEVQALANRFNNNIVVTDSTSGGGGVGMGGAVQGSGKLSAGVTIENELLTTTTQVTGAAASGDGSAQGKDGVPDVTDQSLTAEEAKTGTTSGNNSTSGFNKVAGTHEVKLKDELAEAGEKETDEQGRVKSNTKINGSKKTYDYTKQGVEVESSDSQGQLQSTGLYEEGWLQQVDLSDGTQVTLEYSFDNMGEPKTVDITIKKGDDEKIYKYDGDGNLKTVLKKEGDRFEVEDAQSVEEEEGFDAFMDFMQSTDEQNGDDRVTGDREKLDIKQLQQ
jgi:hypothetical protein